MANGNTSAGGSAQAGQFSIQVGDGSSVLSGGNGRDLLVAEPQAFSADFVGLNGSGVTGTTRISIDGETLRVQVDATGLEPNQPHAMHVHGLVGPDHTPFDAATPTTSLDADGDQFIELAEARRGAGPALVDLGAPQAGSDGEIHIDQSFALSELDMPQGATVADLFPLDFRSVEIHGLTTPSGTGAGTAGEVDGSAGFKATLPVASGTLEFQPLQTFAAQDSQGSFMAGGNGSDRLVGGHGDDVMNGGLGADILAGGAGNDDLIGGSGADRFIFGAGKDVITDFNVGEGDKLVIGIDADNAALVLHDTSQGTWIIEGPGLPTDPGAEGVLLLNVHGTVADAGNWFA